MLAHIAIAAGEFEAHTEVFPEYLPYNFDPKSLPSILGKLEGEIKELADGLAELIDNMPLDWGDGETGDLRDEDEMVQDSEQSITDAIPTIDAGSNLGQQSEAGPESPVLTGLPDSSAQAKIEIPDSATATTTPNDSNATLSVEDLITHLSDVACELEPIVRRSWEFVVDESLPYENLQSGLRRMARGLRATAAVLARHDRSHGGQWR
ncbi:hypothetical protein B0A48_03660 [Cryoendolithus antarcticus]|uniref:Uncharacterized protein n=1 Tax=Cryoendolithus antarcticus TaxID=1507870 RepID=A0A1V8TKM5_9PEZI|nr:hypothetical protein B0A48_03660 [Cryoendolithus antarcticus]